MRLRPCSERSGTSARRSSDFPARQEHHVPRTKLRIDEPESAGPGEHSVMVDKKTGRRVRRLELRALDGRVLGPSDAVVEKRTGAVR